MPLPVLLPWKFHHDRAAEDAYLLNVVVLTANWDLAHYHGFFARTGLDTGSLICLEYVNKLL